MVTSYLNHQKIECIRHLLHSTLNTFGPSLIPATVWWPIPWICFTQEPLYRFPSKVSTKDFSLSTRRISTGHFQMDNAGINAVGVNVGKELMYKSFPLQSQGNTVMKYVLRSQGIELELASSFFLFYSCCSYHFLKSNTAGKSSTQVLFFGVLGN